MYSAASGEEANGKKHGRQRVAHRRNAERTRVSVSTIAGSSSSENTRRGFLSRLTISVSRYTTFPCNPLRSIVITPIPGLRQGKKDVSLRGRGTPQEQQLKFATTTQLLLKNRSISDVCMGFSVDLMQRPIFLLLFYFGRHILLVIVSAFLPIGLEEVVTGNTV